MNRVIGITVLFVFSVMCVAEDKVITVDPNKIQMHGYVHKELPPEMLKRIKATTDVFEIVDGISYEKAVDLYKRDLDPESNLRIWEEMARVYSNFCKSRCKTHDERMDVYRALLLRSMYDEKDALAHLQTNVISKKDAKSIVSQYKLAAQPIGVIQK